MTRRYVDVNANASVEELEALFQGLQDEMYDPAFVCIDYTNAEEFNMWKQDCLVELDRKITAMKRRNENGKL